MKSFLRTDWMVGNVGLGPAPAITTLAHLITISAALSVSAVATNMHVETGGAYYMISRSLGLEIGSATPMSSSSACASRSAAPRRSSSSGWRA